VERYDRRDYPLLRGADREAGGVGTVVGGGGVGGWGGGGGLGGLLKKYKKRKVRKCGEFDVLGGKHEDL